MREGTWVRARPALVLNLAVPGKLLGPLVLRVADRGRKRHTVFERCRVRGPSSLRMFLDKLPQITSPKLHEPAELDEGDRGFLSARGVGKHPFLFSAQQLAAFDRA